MSSSRHGARKPYARPTRGGNMNGQWEHDKFPGANARKPTETSSGKAAEGPSFGNRLEVSNLHYEITPKDLTAIFGQIGTLYDGSGRSLGSAVITFETATEATRAKNQFDGILAKGQPLAIRLLPRPPTAPRRSASAPTSLSLLARIEKAPLLDRVTRDDADAAAASTSNRKTNGPGGGRGRGVGPIRSRGQPHQTRGGRKARENKVPKTAEDLDNELDAFMGDVETTTTTAAGETTSTAVGEAAPAAQDVEMA